MLRGSQLDVVETTIPAPRAEPVKAKKILVCHVASADRWAGAEVQLVNLMRGLGRSEEFSLYAILLNEGQLAEEARRCGVEVKVIPETQKDFLEIFSEATSYLRTRNIHILHSHRYKENLLAALLAWRCKVPYVVRAQQGLPEPFRGWKRCKQGLIQFVDRMVARLATDYVISASNDIRNQLIRCVNPQKVITIHNAVDRGCVRSSLSSMEAKKRLGIPEDCWVVGTAARLEPIKRLDIFLSTACQIAEQQSQTRFVIVGEGSEEARLRERAKTTRLEDRVLFLGHRTDIYDVLRAFDLLVLVSDHEGLPNVLLEALCLGVPVLARRVGGIPELLQDGVNGILVDSSDPYSLGQACLEILRDDGRRQQLASNGASLINERFNSERTAAEFAKLYRSLCGN